MPIGLTTSGEIVFPIHARSLSNDTAERPWSRNQLWSRNPLRWRQSCRRGGKARCGGRSPSKAIGKRGARGQQAGNNRFKRAMQSALSTSRTRAPCARTAARAIGPTIRYPQPTGATTGAPFLFDRFKSRTTRPMRARCSGRAGPRYAAAFPSRTFYVLTPPRERKTTLSLC